MLKNTAQALWDRRSFFGSLILPVAAMLPISARAASHTASAIEQPKSATAKSFIERAFLMRRLGVEKGDRPYGAVVVKNGKIIGQSWSRVVLDRDGTGHAEMAALRDASNRAGPGALAGATLYSSSHPCSMCEAAAAWVGIEKMIYGPNAQDGGRPKSC